MTSEPVRHPSLPVTFHRSSSAAMQAVPRLVQGRAVQPPARSAPKKKFTRRELDRTQTVRRAVQAAFLLLNVWMGLRFYQFVRYYETSGQTAYVPRPDGIDGWLPIAALMNLKVAVTTGRVASVHPAGMFLLLAFAAISFLFRKAFCSWLCPVGTLSEWLWQGGREIFGRNFAFPRWLDIPLRGLKYLLLGLFLYAVVSMTSDEIRGFLDAPYGLIADVKMLNFFRALGTTAAIVILVLVVSSILVKNAWCRYLCPYGALMGLVALVSPASIRRNPDACIDCGKCAKVCPSLLPVDRRITIKSAECTNCLECVSICPARGALDLAAPGRRSVPGWAVAAGIAIVFFGLIGYARLSGHWHTTLPAHTYFELIPNADRYGHPGY